MAYLVLDRSYLQGAKREQIVHLCEEYGVYMTDVLFSELMTTDEESRQRCFQKFPATDNPVELIPNVGYLFHHEVETQTPCTPLHDRRIKVNFQFNPGLATGDFKFTEAQKITLSLLEADLRRRVQTFVESTAVLTGWFPELNGFAPGGPPKLIDQAMNEVVQNHDKVRAIYHAIRAKNFPQAEQIDERWALFRWTQAHLLAAFEFIRRHGDQKPKAVSQTMEHDRLDVDYVILGTLAGALASRDEEVKKFFRLICPNGLLVC